MTKQENKTVFKFEEVKKTYSSSTFAFPQHCDYACAIEIYQPSVGEKIFKFFTYLTPVAIVATIATMLLR